MLFDTTLFDRLDDELKAELLAAPLLETDDFSGLSPQVMRAYCKAMYIPDAGFGSIAGTRRVDIEGPGGNIIPAKLYFATTPRTGAPDTALIAYFHGGGWVSCDIESHDNFCRALCKITGFTVLSVDYRLAPEAPFPAAPEDCYAATRWLGAHAAQLGGDAARLIVAGDSAGGNLAAAVALMSRERGEFSLFHQLLIYPSTRWESWFINGYLASPGDALHPWVSPLLAPDLRGLAPATLVSAEFDGLNAQIDAYQERLIAADVAVRRLHYRKTLHGFLMQYGHLRHAREALAEIGAHLRRIAG